MEVSLCRWLNVDVSDKRDGRCLRTKILRRNGSGLGLAIAKEMITQMGGVLEILDEGPNRLDGTTLRVVLFRDPLNR